LCEAAVRRFDNNFASDEVCKLHDSFGAKFRVHDDTVAVAAGNTKNLCVVNQTASPIPLSCLRNRDAVSSCLLLILTQMSFLWQVTQAAFRTLNAEGLMNFPDISEALTVAAVSIAVALPGQREIAIPARWVALRTCCIS
jgi:hypothetical protein